MGVGHDKAVDWWSLGALLYEMLSGRPPHYKPDARKQILREIVESQVKMKDFFSAESKSILTQLLERNPSKRLGSNNDAKEVMAHPFFREINWQDLRTLKIKPPFKPSVRAADDCSNIDNLFTSETIKETPKSKEIMFEGFN
jgi:p70 ribosomal S6 kinase